MEPSLPKPKIEDLFLGYMAQVNGIETKVSLQSFRQSLLKKGFELNDDDFKNKLKESKEKYFQGDSHIYICTGKSCGAKINPMLSDSRVKPFKHGYQGKYSLTKCQGHCDYAPAITFRSGNRSEIFTQLESETDLEEVFDYCKQSAKERTLLVLKNNANNFSYYPEDKNLEKIPEIESLKYLVGNFRGIGTNHFDNSIFYKDVYSQLELKSKIITLNMSASYQLENGFHDVYYAKSVIYKENNNLKAVFFASEGSVKVVDLHFKDRSLTFNDTIPHSLNEEVKKAVKIISKTDQGYMEKLILQYPDGSEKDYYTVEFKEVL